LFSNFKSGYTYKFKTSLWVFYSNLKFKIEGWNRQKATLTLFISIGIQTRFYVRTTRFIYFPYKLYANTQAKTTYYGIMNQKLYAICIYCFYWSRDIQKIYNKVPTQPPTSLVELTSLYLFWKQVNQNMNGMTISSASLCILDTASYFLRRQYDGKTIPRSITLKYV